MVSEARETIRRLAMAFNDGDIEGMIADLDPEAELYPLRAQLEGKAYRGHDGARQMVADLAEDWEYMRIAVDELFDAGEDQVVALCRLRSRGRASGMDLDVPIAFVWRLRDGKVAYSRSFSEQADALKAAGLE